MELNQKEFLEDKFACLQKIASIEQVVKPKVWAQQRSPACRFLCREQGEAVCRLRPLCQEPRTKNQKHAKGVL
jgi:hypothetical protein